MSGRRRHNADVKAGDTMAPCESEKVGPMPGMAHSQACNLVRSILCSHEGKTVFTLHAIGIMEENALTEDQLTAAVRSGQIEAGATGWADMHLMVQNVQFSVILAMQVGEVLLVIDAWDCDACSVAGR